MSDVLYIRHALRHFGHANIIKYCHRPFLGPKDKEELTRVGAWHNGEWKGEDSSRWRMSREAVEMMDEELLSQINSMVSPDDVLWHLGDFAMPGKSDYYRKCREYRDRIKCRNVYLIWGNHDDRSIRDLFTETYDLRMIAVPELGVKAILCHYAMAVWDGSHRGNIQLYGHSHSEAEPWMNQHMPTRRSIDVGVDNAYKLLGKFCPFTTDALEKLVIKKLGFHFDHHVPKMSQAPKEETLQ